MNMGVVYFGVVGAILSLFAGVCASGHPDQKATKLFRVPWFVVGMIGYVLIAGTAGYPLATKVLAVIVALTTIYLIRKAWKIDLFCPFCMMTWGLNVALVVVAFKSPGVQG